MRFKLKSHRNFCFKAPQLQPHLIFSFCNAMSSLATNWLKILVNCNHKTQFLNIKSSDDMEWGRFALLPLRSAYENMNKCRLCKWTHASCIFLRFYRFDGSFPSQINWDKQEATHKNMEWNGTQCLHSPTNDELRKIITIIVMRLFRWIFKSSFNLLFLCLRLLSVLCWAVHL